LHRGLAEVEENRRWAEALEIHLQPIPRDILVHVRAYREWRVFDRPCCYQDVVNHCRHQFTDYEKVLKQVGDRDSTPPEVYDSIKSRADAMVTDALAALGIFESDSPLDDLDGDDLDDLDGPD